MKDIGVALNSQTTYEDDYGNTKMLSVTDHSPSTGAKIFLYNPNTLDYEQGIVERNKELENKKDNIRNLSSEKLQSLFDLFNHIILFDTDTNLFVWDKEKLESLLEDGVNLNFIQTLLNTGVYYVTVPPNTTVEVRTTKKENLIHVTD